MQDTADLPLSVVLPKNRVVKSYRITVVDAQGTAVRTIEGRCPVPEPDFFKKLFMALGFIPKTSVSPPSVVLWDGRTDAGTFAPDATYQLQASTTDDLGKVASTGPVSVTVDNTPPRVKVLGGLPRLLAERRRPAGRARPGAAGRDGRGPVEGGHP